MKFKSYELKNEKKNETFLRAKRALLITILIVKIKNYLLGIMCETNYAFSLHFLSSLEIATLMAYA